MCHAIQMTFSSLFTHFETCNIECLRDDCLVSRVIVIPADRVSPRYNVIDVTIKNPHLHVVFDAGKDTFSFAKQIPLDGLKQAAPEAAFFFAIRLRRHPISGL